jgi:integrase
VSAFYEFHLAEGDGLPVVNPVPKQRGAGGGRVFEHHNPLDEFTPNRRAPFRQKEPKRLPRAMPEEEVDLVFDQLSSDRDRALLEFYLTSAARPAELIAVSNSCISPQDKTITVVRKGTRAVQALPASAAAFQWFRKYQEKLPVELTGPDEPAWWKLRSPIKPLSYDAMRAVLRRVNETLGTNWTLHDLRHTAAIRMAKDSQMTLPQIQTILGHGHLSTTQEYLNLRGDDVLASAHAHLVRRDKERAEDADMSEADRLARRGGSMSGLNYDPDDLAILFAHTR